MNKKITALVAAIGMTLVLGLVMVWIGAAAAANPNSVPVSDAPGQTTGTGVSPAEIQANIDQLQSLVNQYQQREQQYQAQMNDVQQQLDQADGQIQQYQQLVQFLVSRGILRVDQQGRLSLGGN